ncbi:MAG: hypothetical protein P8L37_00840 [Phycisphaerales bacterium]|nr:hypothetical protein [Phycisphaerales bacterium]
MDLIFSNAANYYYIDLVGMICMLASIWLLGNQKRSGFVIGLVGASSFVVFGVLADSLFAILGNSILAIIYIRGWLCWKPQKHPVD